MPRRAFLREAMRTHPDKGGAAAAFRVVKDAMEVRLIVGRWLQLRRGVLIWLIVGRCGRLGLQKLQVNR